MKILKNVPLIITGILLVPSLTFANLPGHLPRMTTVTDTFNFQIWDGNNIAIWMSNDGAYSTYRATGNSGLEWPAGSEIGAVFDGGLWIASGVYFVRLQSGDLVENQKVVLLK